MRIATENPAVILRDWAESDCDSLVRHANNRLIWRNLTDAFPHPYTYANAVEWIATVATRPDYQIGFRVAKACGAKALHGFDESEIGWDAEPLFDYMQQSAPEFLARFNAEVSRVQAAEAAARRTLSLKQLLKRANDPEQDRENKDFYLLTNAVGAGSGFEGADATARWWHRNFRMYANIQRFATPGERVLVVAGSGHTAILRDLLRIDRRITARDIWPFL